MTEQSILDRMNGRPRMLAAPCSTCVFLPGNPMHLRRGRLAAMVAEARRTETFIVCHKTLTYGEYPDFGPAICRGFADSYSTNLLRIYGRLGGFHEVDAPGGGS